MHNLGRKSIKGGKRGGKERRKEGTYTKSREMIKRIGWEGGIGEKRRADEVKVGIKH